MIQITSITDSGSLEETTIYIPSFSFRKHLSRSLKYNSLLHNFKQYKRKTCFDVAREQLKFIGALKYLNFH